MPSDRTNCLLAWNGMLNRPVVTWIVLLVGEACLAMLAFGAFWFQDWRYSLPTPRPAELKQAAIGEKVLLPSAIGNSQQPTLLHFFNPDCPCSRFNLDHVRELIAKYGGRVRVVAVLETKDAEAALQAFQRLDLACEAVPDPSGEVAAWAGVYSTPQGVVLDERGQLYYRGNYNRGRYCTTAETEFVRVALDGCLAQLSPPHFSHEATIAVGCELPANELTGMTPGLLEANGQ
jgi:hypothetical protein